MGVIEVWGRGEGMQAKGERAGEFDEGSGLIFNGDTKFRQQKILM